MILDVEFIENSKELNADFSENEKAFNADLGEAYSGAYKAGEAAGIAEGRKQGVTEGIEQGKLTERDTFWESFQGGGKRTNYKNAFLLATNFEEFFYPKYDMEGTVFSETFRGAKGNNFNLAQRLRDCGVKLDTSKSTSFEMCFGYSNFLVIPTISFESVTNAYYTGGVFVNNTSLITIEKLIPSKTVGFYTSCFQNCSALENITFEGTIVGNGLNLQWSPNLTHDSLMSVINCLEDKSADTSGTSWVVTVGSTNLAKLTAEDFENIQVKGWNFV